VRKEWVTPIKWIKPGVLVLEHTAFGLDGEKEWRFEVTVSFDAGGKVHVISQKKLKPQADVTLRRIQKIKTGAGEIAKTNSP
jgi:hypothetical protein